MVSRKKELKRQLAKGGALLGAVAVSIGASFIGNSISGIAVPPAGELCVLGGTIEKTESLQPEFFISCGGFLE